MSWFRRIPHRSYWSGVQAGDGSPRRSAISNGPQVSRPRDGLVCPSVRARRSGPQGAGLPQCEVPCPDPHRSPSLSAQGPRVCRDLWPGLRDGSGWRCRREAPDRREPGSGGRGVRHLEDRRQSAFLLQPVPRATGLGPEATRRPQYALAPCDSQPAASSSTLWTRRAPGWPCWDAPILGSARRGGALRPPGDRRHTNLDR